MLADPFDHHLHAVGESAHHRGERVGFSEDRDVDALAAGVDDRRHDHQPRGLEGGHERGVGAPEVHLDVGVERVLVDRRQVVPSDDVEFVGCVAQRRPVAGDQREKPHRLGVGIDRPGEQLLALERLPRDFGRGELHLGR